MSSIWETLSVIDCNQHIEKKGNFSYLSWTWAWAMVKENYPNARYELLDDVMYPDGTMEVRVSVTIADDGAEPLQHTMWLPVLDFKNKAISKPSAFDINSSRMRCLVKCLAMFGLGHYVYAGESAPQVPGLSSEEFDEVVRLLAEKDGIGLVRYMAELGEDKSAEAFNRAPTGQKMKFKDSIRDLLKVGQSQIDAYVTTLDEHIENNDESGVMEIIEELSDDKWLKGQVWARLTDIQKHQIKAALEQAA